MDARLFNEVHAALLEHIPGDDEGRSALVTQAWFGETALISSITLGGNNRVFLTNLLTEADRYGLLSGGEHYALVALIEAVATGVSENQQATLQGLITDVVASYEKERQRPRTLPTQPNPTSTRTQQPWIFALVGLLAVIIVGLLAWQFTLLQPAAVPTPTSVAVLPSATSTANPLIASLASDFSTLSGQATLQTVGEVAIRNRPNGMRGDTLNDGDLVTVNMDSVTQQAGWYWVEHSEGWSTLQTVDGEDIFFAIPGGIPEVENIPGYQTLITRHPVDLENVTWFQYFGNTPWAYVRGPDFNYDGFSQGLDGALTYGNTAGGANVYAGAVGTYVGTIYDSQDRAWNHQVRVETPDGHLLIYQHVTPADLEDGQAVTPDTIIGTISNEYPGGGHQLRFIVRYENSKWIVNPLAFMEPMLVNDITAQFDPRRPTFEGWIINSELNYFYQFEEWNQWVTPLDQPVIEVGGDPIGPRAQGY